MAQKSDKPQGINGSVYTRYQQKKYGLGRGRDGGGKQMKIRQVYATVASPLGPQPVAGLTIREIRCPVPRTRKEKYLLGAPTK